MTTLTITEPLQCAEIPKAVIDTVKRLLERRGAHVGSHAGIHRAAAGSSAGAGAGIGAATCGAKGKGTNHEKLGNQVRCFHWSRN